MYFGFVNVIVATLVKFVVRSYYQEILNPAGVYLEKNLLMEN